MATEPTSALDPESKTDPATSSADAASKENGKKEETVGEILNVPSPAEKAEDTVPLSALIEVKKENKRLAKDMANLKKSIEDGAKNTDVAQSIEAIADEFPDVDPNFLKKFAAAVRAEVKQETEAEMASKLKPLQEKEREAKIEQAFSQHFDKAMEAMPEYTGVVNRDVIKALSLLPQNAHKTLTQIIEGSFGHLITGKRTIDAGSARAGKNNDTEVDHARAKKDPEYFKEIMANPTLKKKYNSEMLGRIASQL